MAKDIHGLNQTIEQHLAQPTSDHAARDNLLKESIDAIREVYSGNDEDITNALLRSQTDDHKKLLSLTIRLLKSGATTGDVTNDQFVKNIADIADNEYKKRMLDVVKTINEIITTELSYRKGLKALFHHLFIMSGSGDNKNVRLKDQKNFLKENAENLTEKNKNDLIEFGKALYALTEPDFTQLILPEDETKIDTIKSAINNLSTLFEENNLNSFSVYAPLQSNTLLPLCDSIEFQDIVLDTDKDTVASKAITPIQRPPRYVLLLADLQKKLAKLNIYTSIDLTETNTNLSEYLKKSQTAAERMNDSIDKDKTPSKDKDPRLKAIQESLEFLNSYRIKNVLTNKVPGKDHEKIIARIHAIDELITIIKSGEFYSEKLKKLKEIKNKSDHPVHKHIADPDDTSKKTSLGTQLEELIRLYANLEFTIKQDDLLYPKDATTKIRNPALQNARLLSHIYEQIILAGKKLPPEEIHKLHELETNLSTDAEPETALKELASKLREIGLKLDNDTLITINEFYRTNIINAKTIAGEPAAPKKPAPKNPIPASIKNLNDYATGKHSEDRKEIAARIVALYRANIPIELLMAEIQLALSQPFVVNSRGENKIHTLLTNLQTACIEKHGHNINTIKNAAPVDASEDAEAISDSNKITLEKANATNYRSNIAHELAAKESNFMSNPDFQFIVEKINTLQTAEQILEYIRHIDAIVRSNDALSAEVKRGIHELLAVANIVNDLKYVPVDERNKNTAGPVYGYIPRTTIDLAGQRLRMGTLELVYEEHPDILNNIKDLHQKIVARYGNSDDEKVLATEEIMMLNRIFLAIPVNVSNITNSDLNKINIIDSTNAFPSAVEFKSKVLPELTKLLITSQSTLKKHTQSRLQDAYESFAYAKTELDKPDNAEEVYGWTKDPKDAELYQKYGYHTYIYKPEERNELTGSDGTLVVKVYDKNSYDLAKTEDFIERGNLVFDATKMLIDKQDPWNTLSTDQKDKIKSWLDLQKQSLAQRISAQCKLDPKVMSGADFKTAKKAFEASHEVARHLTSESIIDLIHYMKLVSNDKVTKSTIIDVIEQAEKDYVDEKGRPNIIKISDFGNGLTAISAQFCQGDHTTPSSIRNRSLDSPAMCSNHVLDATGDIKDGQVNCWSVVDGHSSYPPIADADVDDSLTADVDSLPIIQSELNDDLSRRYFAYLAAKEKIAATVRDMVTEETTDITLSLSSLMLLSPGISRELDRFGRVIARQSPGENEHRQLSDSSWALDILMYGENPLTFRVNGRDINVTLNLTHMNVSANLSAKTKHLANSALTDNINARGFFEYSQLAETRIKQSHEIFKSVMPVELTQKLDSFYSQFSPEQVDGINVIIRKNNDALKPLYQNLRQTLELYNSPVATEAEKKTLRETYEQQKKHIDALEKDNFKAYATFMTARSKVIAASVNRPSDLFKRKFDFKPLYDSISAELKKDESKPGYHNYLLFQRRYLEAQDILFNQKNHDDPKYKYIFHALYLLTNQDMGRAIETFCKSGEDRTGYLRVSLMAYQIFNLLNKRDPDLSNPNDVKKFEDLIAKTAERSASLECNNYNAPGARGFQVESEFTIAYMSISKAMGNDAKHFYKTSKLPPFKYAHLKGLDNAPAEDVAAAAKDVLRLAIPAAAAPVAAAAAPVAPKPTLPLEDDAPALARPTPTRPALSARTPTLTHPLSPADEAPAEKPADILPPPPLVAPVWTKPTTLPLEDDDAPASARPAPTRPALSARTPTLTHPLSPADEAPAEKSADVLPPPSPLTAPVWTKPTTLPLEDDDAPARPSAAPPASSTVDKPAAVVASPSAVVDKPAVVPKPAPARPASVKITTLPLEDDNEPTASEKLEKATVSLTLEIQATRLVVQDFIKALDELKKQKAARASHGLFAHRDEPAKGVTAAPTRPKPVDGK